MIISCGMRLRHKDSVGGETEGGALHAVFAEHSHWATSEKCKEHNGKPEFVRNKTREASATFLWGAARQRKVERGGILLLRISNQEFNGAQECCSDDKGVFEVA